MKMNFLCALAVSFVAVGFCGGADWLQFRGQNASSVSSLASPPLSWDAAKRVNIAWKVSLPGKGVSSPILVGDKVIVTASSGFEERRLHVLCYDQTSGNLLWERRFWATGRPYCHPTSANAACTPASDGQFIYAFFSSNDLICLDLNGRLKWLRGLGHDYPKVGNDIGMSSSPLVLGDTVIVQVENPGDSFAAGIDKYTGVNKWRLDRATGSIWSSPIPVITEGNKQLVLLQTMGAVTAHDPDSGKELWRHVTECDSTVSPVSEDGMIYVPAEGITALKASEKEAIPVWRKSNIKPDNASLIAYKGRIFAMNGAGVINCGDSSTGEILWKLRLKGGFWATPVICNDHLFAVNQEGLVQVVALDGEARIIGEIEMAEPILASPALGDGALYLRSYGSLWKVAAK